MLCLITKGIRNGPYFFLHVHLVLLSLQSFPHAKNHAALVKGLVSGDGHLDLISDPQQQVTTLCAVDSHLPDQLIYIQRAAVIMTQPSYQKNIHLPNISKT